MGEMNAIIRILGHIYIEIQTSNQQEISIQQETSIQQEIPIQQEISIQQVISIRQEIANQQEMSTLELKYKCNVLACCLALRRLDIHQGLAHQCDTWTALFERGRTLDHQPGMLHGLVHHAAEASSIHIGEGCEDTAYRLLHKLCSGPGSQFQEL